MRIALAAALLVSLAAVTARADDGKQAPPKAKKTLRMGAVGVSGHRQVPVAIVLTRDETAKRVLDESIDEHVRDPVQDHH